MESAKKALEERISHLDEQEAAQVLDFIEHLSRRQEEDEVWRSLGENPTFRLPASRYPRFPPITPLKLEGGSASEMLIRERR